MNYDAEFCRQIRVRKDEKRQCLVLVTEILQLATKARKYGLLSLGKEAEESPSFLLRKGLQLALDGVKSPIARSILELYILTGEYKGKELLESCIILEGVVGILEGIHPKLLKELLLCFLGETGHILFKEEFDAGEKQKLASYLDKIEKKPATTDSSAELGKIIAGLDGKAIKGLLQTVDIEDLARTIKDMEGKVQLKIFDHLPEKGSLLLLEALEQIDPIEPHEILEARNRIGAIISELKARGRTR
jgi:hypothetical protein